MAKINKTNWTRPAAKLKTNMTTEEAEKLVNDLVDKTMDYGQELTIKNLDAMTDAADKLVAALTGKEE